MPVVKVPKTPKRAFNKRRRPSALLKGQIAHLEWAALPASKRKPGRLPKIDVRTEGQAAERIAELTTLVLQQSGAYADRPPQGDVGLPAAPGAPQTTPASRPATRSTRSKRAATRRKKKTAKRTRKRR